MSYADNKRSQVSREFGALNVFGFSLASALGIASAVVVDLLQAREASALYLLNRWLLELTGLLGIEALPLYSVMGLLMAVGAGSVFVTEPVSVRGAFIQGFGALAVLTTMAPADLGAPLPAPREPSGSVPLERSMDQYFEPASLRQRGGSGAENYELRLQVEFPDGLQGDLQNMLRRQKLVGKLYNTETGVKYDLFRNSGAEMSYRDGTLRIVTEVAAADAEAPLWILIEAEGYKINEERFIARSGANPIWNVRMTPSKVPLLIQRLRHPYHF